MTDAVKSYIQSSSAKVKENLLFDRVLVMESEPLPEMVNLENVLAEIENLLSPSLMSNVDAIYIGQFPELKQREVSAVFADGAIFVTNEQESDYELVEDIVHEVAHSIEEIPGVLGFLYDDVQIEREFLAKRQTLVSILKTEGFQDFDYSSFSELDYVPEVDTFLYAVVGYPLLTNITMGLFVTPYGATSLREYFANAFEEFFLGEPMNVQKISPMVYQKILNLIEHLGG